MTDSGQDDQKHREDYLEMDYSLNGLILCGNTMPLEILLSIFFKMDNRSLVNCQMVCKKWEGLLKTVIWPEKAEKALGYRLVDDDAIPWYHYYFWAVAPFYKNLLKNPSGENNNVEHWNFTKKSSGETVNKFSVVDLPATLFRNNCYPKCFQTSHAFVQASQTVNLVDLGFSPKLLDELRPTIEFSEWFYLENVISQITCDFQMKLGKDKAEPNRAIRSVYYNKIITSGSNSEWRKMTRRVKKYGAGLRKLRYIRGAVIPETDAGHSSCCFVGACIKVTPF